MKEKLFTKNFTLLILGQITSLFGNFILKFALSMYVLEITGSAAKFASILALATIPTILLSPLGGILADRANRKKIMVALDAISGISVLLAVIFSNFAGLLLIISILLILLSILGAFESPTVQACVPQMLAGDNIIKGNAVVNQVAAVASLIAPILGSVLYTAFGIRPVMYITILCFFITAGLECFIKLDYTKVNTNEKIFSIIKNDFTMSMHFMKKEQPNILKILLLSTLVNFFVVGVVYIGLPFIVRNVLEMNAAMYGISESLIGFAAIIGSILAGLLTSKLKINKLSYVIGFVGLCFVFSGTAFILPVTAFMKYVINLIGFCGFQMAVCVFSIFALSFIQQKTPNHLIGKVMSYVMTISICSQPLSHAIYGVAFDIFKDSVYLILTATGIIIFLIGLLSTSFFKKITPSLF